MRHLAKRLYLISTGGIMLGVATAWHYTDLSAIFTNFLSTLFAALVSLFLGGDTSNLFRQGIFV